MRVLRGLASTPDAALVWPLLGLSREHVGLAGTAQADAPPPPAIAMCHAVEAVLYEVEPQVRPSPHGTVPVLCAHASSVN